MPELWRLPPCPHSAPISTCEQPQSLPKTQEYPDTFKPRGPKITQMPLDQEDPGASTHHWTKRTGEHPDSIRPRGPKSTQAPLDKETFPVPLSEVEMGRRQSKSTYNNIKNKTTPESSPPPTPRPEHCNVDKAEENDP
ncbi:hypothetical protein STEG23_028959 [Scotinomys teguina]